MALGWTPISMTFYHFIKFFSSFSISGESRARTVRSGLYIFCSSRRDTSSCRMAWILGIFRLNTVSWKSNLFSVGLAGEYKTNNSLTNLSLHLFHKHFVNTHFSAFIYIYIFFMEPSFYVSNFYKRNIPCFARVGISAFIRYCRMLDMWNENISVNEVENSNSIIHDPFNENVAQLLT